MKFVECRGSAVEMGRQYGEAARSEIRYAEELWTPFFKKYPQRPYFMQEACAALERYAPDVLSELKGVADGAGVAFSVILAINYVDTFGPEVERCTPLMLRHSPDGIIVAKNNDAGDEEKFPFVIRRCVPDKGIPFIQVTYAGWISGLDMMNSEGLANTHGSVGSIFPRPQRRIDIRLRIYELMKQCRNIDQLIYGLQAPDFPLTGKGFSIAAGDKRGECAFIDAAVPNIVVRDRNREFSWSTNIYEASGLENADRRPVELKPFYRARNRYIAECQAPADLEGVKAILSDHSVPHAPCRHGKEANAVTAWAMYCLPEKGVVGVADGNPCCNPFTEYSL